MHVQAEILREAALAGSGAASDLLCSKTMSPVMEWSEPLAKHPDLRGALYAAVSSGSAGCILSTSKYTASLIQLADMEIVPQGKAVVAQPGEKLRMHV